MFEDLGLVIEHITSLYNTLASKWIEQYGYKNLINLKKKTVSDIYNQDYILEYIKNYMFFLFDETLGLNPCAELELKNSVTRFRLKTTNSVDSKIITYNQKTHRGKIPINKCLNDLCGFRIVLNSNFCYEDILGYISEDCPNLKCIDSSKNGYIATHIYFSLPQDNKLFPWELQVWRQCDEKHNIENHSIYKQRYTKWENRTKGGLIL